MLALAQPFTLLFIGVHAVVVLLLASLVYRSTHGPRRWAGALILIPWFALTVVLAAADSFRDVSGLISPLAVAMMIPVIAGVVLLARASWMRDLVAALPVRWLMGLQVYRVLGFIFLVGWLSGEVPTALGTLTPFWDIAIGLSALPMAAVALRRPGRARLWNVVGILDFVYAVSLGVMALPALNLIALDPAPTLLGQLPLSLIVVWAVPLSILLHVFSLYNLRAQSAAAASAEPTPARLVA